MSILDYAPGPLRPQQIEFLLWFEQNYDKNDVLVCQAPTSAGKSWMIIAAARWLAKRGQKSAIVVPNKILQDQYAAEFTEYPNLKGADNYQCEDKGGKCGDIERVKRCGDCHYVQIKNRANRESIGIFNYWTYMYNDMQKTHSHLILDEAHNAVSIISDLSTVKVRQSQTSFPANLSTHFEIATWLEKYLQELRNEELSMSIGKERRQTRARGDQVQRCLDDIKLNYQDYHFKITEEYFGRGKDKYKEKVLTVSPIAISHLPCRLWPRAHIKKILMFSATIDVKDLRDLGLSDRKHAIFNCSSPIPAINRPFVVNEVVDMSYAKRAQSMPKLIERIKEIADYHSDQKGLIHCTYGVAAQLRKVLWKDDRFIWHTKSNKMAQYGTFRAIDEPKIFIASGMEEGIDLAYDQGRWQIIACIPYANFGDLLVKAKAKKDSIWYNRYAARIIQQQTGRICRTPTDTGVTYILDKRFVKFYNSNRGLWPKWFTEAIIWNK